MVNRKKLFVVGMISSLCLSACQSKHDSPFGEINLTADTIIGGQELSAQDDLHSSIVIVYNNSDGGLCTGSLITPNLVLTAAHCIESDTSDLYIYFGVKIAADSLGFKVKKAEIPFSRFTTLHDKNQSDIALLYFSGDIPSGYKAAKMASASHLKQLKKGASVVIAGYGISDEDPYSGAGILRSATIRVEDPKYSASEVTLNQEKGIGACHGDSGGPAYLKINGAYYLWGVARGNADNQSTSCGGHVVYTLASYYKTWLNRAANKLVNSAINPRIGP